MLSKRMSKLNMKVLVGTALIATFAVSAAAAVTPCATQIQRSGVAVPATPAPFAVALPGRTGLSHPAPGQRQVVCSPDGQCIIILDDGTEIDM
jgi:hypothetical protein